MRNVRKPVAGICTCSDPEGNIFTCRIHKTLLKHGVHNRHAAKQICSEATFSESEDGKRLLHIRHPRCSPTLPKHASVVLAMPFAGATPMAVGAPLQVASRPQQVLAALCCASHAAITPLTGRWRCRSHGRWRRHDPQAPLLAVLAAQQASAGGVRTFFQSVLAVGSAVGVTVGRRIGHAARH